MKNRSTFLFYFFSIVYLHCQVKVIDIENPGSLSKLLGSEINSITELKINGKINSVDYTTLKSMKKLSVLDLSNSGTNDGILPANIFEYNTILKNIILPSSLTTISDFAFQFAYNVSIDASKCTQLKNIGLSAFHSVQGKVTLPDQLETLLKLSFAGFKGTVVLPKNLKSINKQAFSNSQINILDFTLCTQLETIDNKAFEFAKNLNLDLSKATKLKNIGEEAFDHAKGKIILPDQLEILPEFSFADFNGTIVLPKNLKTIEKNAFYYSQINTLDFSKCALLENIGRAAFYHVSGKVILPNQLEILPEFSFEFFDGTVVLPKNLKNIGKKAFSNSQINTLDFTLCTQLETIDNKAFEFAKNLNLDLSKATKLKNIEKEAFHSLKGKIILPDHLEALPELSFSGFNGTVVLPRNLKTIGKEAFYFSKINTLDLTQCPLLETIENSAFKYASNLNLDLSKSTKLKNIGKAAFLGAEGKIILPNHLEILPELSFAGFNGTVVLPKNLKIIDEKAFYHSPINTLDLTQCPLLETISNNAFKYPSNLNLDLSKSTKLKNIGKYAFNSLEGTIILPDHLETIPELSFAYFNGTVVLPKNLKSIDKNAFYSSEINTFELTQFPLTGTNLGYVSNLNLDLSKATQLKNIGKEAFHSLRGKIILPDQLEILPEGSFAYFNGTVVLPKNLKSINKQAFYNSKIKEINLPGSLQSIADEAFYNAKYLSTISCNAATPPLLGENVFYGVNKNTCSLKVPDASRKLYAKAEQWKDF